MNENTDKLINCFIESLGVDKAVVTDELAYQSIPEWDSVGHMALIATLEDEFDLMLDTNEILDMSTVSKAKEILNNHGVEFNAA